MTPSTVTDLMFEQLKFRGDRQKVISSNIANLNTPKYKTKDVSFEDHMQSTKNKDDLALMQTHKNHMSMDSSKDMSKDASKLNYFEVKGLEVQNDGNNVSLDKQISEMSKNSIIHDAIANSIKKDSTWFKLMVDASGKN